MEQDAHALLASWEAFNVIVGPAASAHSAPRRSSTSVLFIAAMPSAPWPALSPVALVLGACAVVGLVYTLLVARRARRQTAYVLVLEDWIWHAALPLIAYALLLVAAFLLQLDPATILFVIGGIVLLLLFIRLYLDLSRVNCG